MVNKELIELALSEYGIKEWAGDTHNPEVLKYFDFAVTHGHRTPEEQFELFKKGRSLNMDGKWIITDRKKVVTYVDGYEKKSKHNAEPSKAIDMYPSPVSFEKDQLEAKTMEIINKTIQMK